MLLAFVVMFLCFVFVVFRVLFDSCGFRVLLFNTYVHYVVQFPIFLAAIRRYIVMFKLCGFVVALPSLARLLKVGS